MTTRLPHPSCPGRLVGDRLCPILAPCTGLVPVRTPCTRLQVGHCRKGEGAAAAIWRRQAAWKAWVQSARRRTSSPGSRSVRQMAQGSPVGATTTVCCATGSAVGVGLRVVEVEGIGGAGLAPPHSHAMEGGSRGWGWKDWN